MTTDIRATAATVLASIPVPISSKDKGPLFEKYATPHTHNELITYWENHPPPDKHVLTTCNEFVNWYCSAIGFSKKLGAFETESFLKQNGLHHAWVTPAPGRDPKFGDILRHASYHMDVSMGVVGGNLIRMASGQHGPVWTDGAAPLKKGESYDLIARVGDRPQDKPYDPGKLTGWIDIELIWPQLQPVPAFLRGWWKHVFDDSGDTYYYLYDHKRVVRWSAQPPLAMWSLAIAMDGGPGVYLNQEPNEVTIKWNSGSTEVYTWDGARTMNGVYNGGPDTLTATKLSP